MNGTNPVLTPYSALNMLHMPQSIRVDRRRLRGSLGSIQYITVIQFSCPTTTQTTTTKPTINKKREFLDHNKSLTISHQPVSIASFECSGSVSRLTECNPQIHSQKYCYTARCRRRRQPRDSSSVHHKLVTSTAAATDSTTLLSVAASELHATGSPTESCLL